MKRTPPIHGGDIATASQIYGREKAQWIDLSTGINPRPYPFQSLPASAYTDLPYLDEEFIPAAKAYYGCDQLLATSGSQMVIQNLVHVLAALPMLVPTWGYQEYRHHWLQAQRPVVDYPSHASAVALASILSQLKHNPAQHVLIIQPNNPSGMYFEPEQISAIAAELAPHAYLIIDEAFIDAEDQASVLATGLANNMVVLRSFGKFFGLAGIRLGFVFANDSILAKLSEKIGLWAINGPAQAIAKQAFVDRPWQQNIQSSMDKDTRYIRQLFAGLLQDKTLAETHTRLFSSYLLSRNEALTLYELLCRQAVLTRLLDYDAQHLLLRIGRVNSESEQALTLQQRVQNISAK